MKEIKKLITGMVMFAALCSLMYACDVDDGSYTEPISLYEKVGGHWNLTRMKQVDELATVAGTGTTEMDITGFFENFSITLNVDENKKPTTFKTSGAPALIPESGYWQLDKVFQNWDGTPVTLQFFSDAECTKQIGAIAVSSVPGSAATMELRLTRKTNGIPFVSYTYTLIPVNN